MSVYLSGYSATGDLDLYLEDAGGKVVAKSNGVGEAPEVVNLASNEATRYYVRIQPVGSDAASKYSLSITGVGTSPVKPQLLWQICRDHRRLEDLPRRRLRCTMMHHAYRPTGYHAAGRLGDL